MFAIYKREMRAYFTTPQGYLFMAIFLCASGFLFSLSTLLMQSSDTATYFQFLMYGYIVLVPLLTMKSFAEEKKAKTEPKKETAKPAEKKAPAKVSEKPAEKKAEPKKAEAKPNDKKAEPKKEEPKKAAEPNLHPFQA
jgi:hypothetical protein